MFLTLLLVSKAQNIIIEVASAPEGYLTETSDSGAYGNLFTRRQ